MTLGKAIYRSPGNPGPPEAGVLCWAALRLTAKGPLGPFFILALARVGHWPTWPRRLSPPPFLSQWPSQCRRLRGLRDRRWAPDLRCAGWAGNGKNIPSGNSRYRLKTCTSSSPWPSPPRRPSITNLVPTGKRLGRRLELYTMTSSCDATTLPVQYVIQLTRSV